MYIKIHTFIYNANEFVGRRTCNRQARLQIMVLLRNNLGQVVCTMFLCLQAVGYNLVP